MWVPIVENGEYDKPGADYFISRHIDTILTKDPKIDTLILACTHYPILEKKIRQFLPENINIISQGKLVADSLANYLARHPEMDARLSKTGTARFCTTESENKFSEMAATFLGSEIRSERVEI